jgi:hypothetical protein
MATATALGDHWGIPLKNMTPRTRSSSNCPWRWLAGLLWLLALWTLGMATLAQAHDIPADVRIQAFVKPQGQQLQLLLRVPLGAMNEVDMPLRGPGYLDLSRADAALRVAAELWFADNLSVLEEGQPLLRPTLAAARISLASDRSFATWESALAQLRSAPIPVSTELHWKAQHFDLLLTFSIASENSRFTIEPRWARLGLKVVTTLKFLPPAGAERAFEFHGNPGPVALDPRWFQAAGRFVVDGFWHILDGTDHLLFIACLVIPFRRLRPLVVIATAFTLAHSLTLAACALGWAPQGLWFPPLVELLIAASIVAMALENVFGTSERRRWIAAFVFGLVHGFGFAFALGETLQFAGSHLATALLAFNIGVEFGQLALLIVLVPALNALRRVLPERALILVLSALMAHTAWHWVGERWAQLRQFQVPVIDATAGASLLRWLMAALALALVVWAVDRWVRRWMGCETMQPPASSL